MKYDKKSAIDFTGLESTLSEFEENGKYAIYNNWSIANGGYDLFWEIYYKGYTVLQCIDGELQDGFRPIPEFTEEAEKELIKRVKKVYTEL